MKGCPDHTTDMAVARNIRFGKSRNLQLRADAFNVFNTAIITGRNTTVNYQSPTNQTVTNSETLADGSIDPTRLTPRTAGFGAANLWSTNSNNGNYQRVIQITVRVSF
jgi:hypothetical protein